MTTIPGPYLYGQYTGAAPYGPAISQERLPDVVIHDADDSRGGNGSLLGLLIVLVWGAALVFPWW
jgi:hypothetical protein